MTDEPPFCLHVGLPRTGSKSLQWNLLADHPEAMYLGIHDGNPRHRHTAPWRFHRDARSQELFDQLIWTHTRAPDLERCRQLADELRREAGNSGRRLVYSLETLSTNFRAVRRARAEHLWRVFGRNVRVLIVLRSPIRLIESAYGLVLRRENTEAHDHRLWYRTIDDWFEEAIEGEAQAYLDYAATIQIYEDLFGRDAVKVLLFEDLIQDPDTFEQGVCRHFGLSPLARQARPAPANVSPREWQVFLLRAITRTRPAEALVARLRPRWRFALLGPSSIGRVHRPSLSGENRRRIAEATAPGNRTLAATHRLDLEQHGYPL